MNDCRDGSDEKNCPNEGNSVKAYKSKNRETIVLNMI